MFLDIRFPDDISSGSSGGPSYRTSVVESLNGKKKKNIIWTYPLHIYDVSYAVKTRLELEAVIDFFHVCQGRANNFRFKDWADFKSCSVLQAIAPTDQVIGVGNGVITSFQLIKTYSRLGFSKTRKITKPIASTVVAALNGTTTTAFTLNDLGVITFASPPAPGVTISAGYEFDVPCEFGSDDLETSLDTYISGSTTLEIREVRL